LRPATGKWHPTNGRTINSGSVFTKEVIPLVASLPKLGIRPATLAMQGSRRCSSNTADTF
jgi:hypothetical protein